MKKAYENPVAEKIVFDYTTTVVASGTTQYKTTLDHKCVVIIEEPKPTKPPIIIEIPTECGNNLNRCRI